MRTFVYLGIAALLSACVADKPAPVVDRTPPPGSAATATETGSYTVKRGDTVYSIAREQRVDPRELMAWNRMGDPARLSVGQVIRVRAPQTAENVPPSTGAPPLLAGTVIEGRSLGPPHATVIAAPPVAATNAPPLSNGLLKTQPKGMKLPYSEQNLAAVQKAEVSNAAPAPSTAAMAPAGSSETDGIEWAWPATGTLIARFSEGGVKGVEIAGKEGEAVLAAASGKVMYSGAGIRGYGNLVIIRHNAQFSSVYAHNKVLTVKQDESVSRGQKIAEFGSSGEDAAKLHFEIRRQGKPVDPAEYLPPRN